MNDSFWKKMCIVLFCIIIVLIGTSAYYYNADLGDVASSIDGVKSELGYIYNQLGYIQSSLSSISSNISDIAFEMKY